METKLSRQEMRSIIFARMGIDTAGGQDPQSETQCNSLIDEAAIQVGEACRMQTTMAETRQDVTTDQRFFNYPTNAGPGEIISIALWDEDIEEFVPLRRRRITPEMDDEPLVELGEPYSVEGRGKPCYFELKSQIEIWPRPDQAYRLKIDHTRNFTFSADGTVSLVDSEAIIRYVMSALYDYQGDDRLADRYMMKYQQRIDQITGGQSPVKVFRRGGNKLVDRRIAATDWDVNSGRWPSEVP